MNLPIDADRDPRSPQQQIAALKEENRRLKLKQGRKMRNKEPGEFVHPGDDVTFERSRKVKKFRNAVGRTASILKHGSRQVLQTYYDPGPGPAGWVNTPATTFERDLFRVAERLGVQIPLEFIQEAGLAIEKRVDERYRTTEDRFRRAINSAAFLIWSHEGGPQPKWWELHNCPEDEDSDEAARPTNTTDAAPGTLGTQPSETNDEDDAPQEYYSLSSYNQDEGDDSPDEDAEEDTVVADDEFLEGKAKDNADEEDDVQGDGDDDDVVEDADGEEEDE